MHNISYKSWSKFKSDMINDILSSSGQSTIRNFLFRGQADSQWQLQSSFDRIENDKSKYDILIKNFIAVCQTYNYLDDLFTRENNELLVAAYGQHYGLPTRLLDWTTSPYFAAFFATDSALRRNIKKKCTIWAINKESISLSKSQGVKFIKLPTNKYNYRIKNQLGHFTLSIHSEDSIDEFDTNQINKGHSDDMLWKIDLEFEDPRDILMDLYIMGINHSIAYPDLEGYIKEAIYETKL